jgi:hypothetical protein
MALDDVVRSGVATIDSITGSLQVLVSHEAWTGQSGTGTETFAAAVQRPAIVEKKAREHRLSNGRVLQTVAYIAFLRPITANGAAGRIEPIDVRDKFTLPDGTTGPVIDTNAFLDPDTNAGYLHEVWLGRAGDSVGGS